MYHGNYKPQHQKAKRKGGKTGALLLSLLLIAALAVSGTVAYLLTKTEPVQNTFTPSNVTCTVTEEFNGTTKSNVNVKNTGNTDAYIRVKLVTYRVNSQNQHIGGTAEIPEFTPGTGWVLNTADGYYYYTSPVKPNKKPATDLIGDSGITLNDYTTIPNDPDGGKQVIEVMAEAIQSQGVGENNTPAVTLAWNVSVGADGNLSIGNSSN